MPRMDGPPTSYTFIRIDHNGDRTTGCVRDGVVVHEGCDHAAVIPSMWGTPSPPIGESK